jgi:hypothetical protein
MTTKQPKPFTQSDSETSKNAIIANFTAWKTHGDFGARDRFRSALMGRLVKRFGTRRVRRFSDIVAKLSTK